MRPLVTLLAGALLATSFGGCSLGQKKALARSIVDAYELTTDRGTARGAITQLLKINLPDLGPDVKVPKAPRFPPITTGVLLDFTKARAGVVFQPTPEAASEVVAVLDGLTLYQRKVLVPGEDIGGRPWYKLDYHDLSDEVEQLDTLDGLPQFVLNVVNPIHLIRLSKGVLTGSIEDRGREAIAGVDTTRYSVRFSRSAAFSSWNEEELDALNGGLAAMRVRPSDDVVPGDVWLDDEGAIRQISVRFRERFPERASVDITVTVRIDGFGEPVQVDIPTPREISRVRGFGGITTQLGPRTSDAEGL